MLYTINIPYKCITTLNSRVAVINDNSSIPAGNLPTYSTSPELGPSSLSHQSQSYRHIHTDMDFDSKSSMHAGRTMSMDYRDSSYPLKKKEGVENSMLMSQPSDGRVNVYDVNANGKLDLVSSFIQEAGVVLWVCCIRKLHCRVIGIQNKNSLLLMHITTSSSK